VIEAEVRDLGGGSGRESTYNREGGRVLTHLGVRRGGGRRKQSPPAPGGEKKKGGALHPEEGDGGGGNAAKLGKGIRAKEKRPPGGIGLKKKGGCFLSGNETRGEERRFYIIASGKGGGDFRDRGRRRDKSVRWGKG